MRAVGASAFVAVFLWCSMPVQGALYEFTLQGQVTFSALGSNPSVGDLVTITYVADSDDLDPRAGVGRYAASGARMQLPHATFAPVTDGILDVLNVAGNFNRVDYQCVVQDPQQPNPWTLDIALAFPEGTFDSEALPLALPLSDAVVRRFAVIPILTELFRGNITSYTSVEVPEPQYVGGLILFMLLAYRISSECEDSRNQQRRRRTP